MGRRGCLGWSRTAWGEQGKSVWLMAYGLWPEIGSLQDEFSDHKLYAISH